MSEQAGASGTPGASAENQPASSASGTPGAGAGNQPAGNPAAQGAGNQPAASPAGAGSGAQQFSYAEDRTNWVPPHRLREITQARQQIEQQLQHARQQVAALTNTPGPAQPSDPQQEALRRELFQLVPGLDKLLSISEKLQALAQVDPQDVTGAQEHYWTMMGNQTLRQVEGELCKALGTDKLTPFAQQSVRQSFAVYVQSNPEAASKYASQDPSLITDFVQEYTTGILEPHRRSITTTVQQPRVAAVSRLPRGGNSTAIPGQGRGTLKPTDSDEFHRAAFASIAANQ
jgi:hypothetical protein